jgi:hypothetical protein
MRITAQKAGTHGSLYQSRRLHLSNHSAQVATSRQLGNGTTRVRPHRHAVVAAAIESLAFLVLDRRQVELNGFRTLDASA